MRLGEFEIAEPVPELKDPHVLAVLRPWIDVGNVGTLSLNRLERHLHAKDAGKLARPGRFYDFTRYRPRSYLNHGQREYSIPNTMVRYASREQGPDLILLHLLEPHAYGEDYTDSVIELLKFFGVRRYSLIGAMYDMVPHTRPLLVSGGVGEPEGEEEYRLVKARPSNYEGPSTITYLVSLEAAQMGMETRTFVVHLPQYFQVDEDFNGTARLMEILCTLYQLPKRLMDQQRGAGAVRRPAKYCQRDLGSRVSAASAGREVRQGAGPAGRQPSTVTQYRAVSPRVGRGLRRQPIAV